MLSTSTAETEKIAKHFADKLPRNHRGPFIIGLVGELGTGKTSFVKSFLHILGIKKNIVSPTFVLVREYGINKSCEINIGKKLTKAYHIDVYRLSGLRDMYHLSFHKLLQEKNSILLIEWADKIRKIMPKNTIWIKFKHGARDNERIITISKTKNFTEDRSVFG